MADSKPWEAFADADTEGDAGPKPWEAFAQKPEGPPPGVQSQPKSLGWNLHDLGQGVSDLSHEVVGGALGAVRGGLNILGMIDSKSARNPNHVSPLEEHMRPGVGDWDQALSQMIDTQQVSKSPALQNQIAQMQQYRADAATRGESEGLAALKSTLLYPDAAVDAAVEGLMPMGMAAAANFVPVVGPGLSAGMLGLGYGGPASRDAYLARYQYALSQGADESTAQAQARNWGVGAGAVGGITAVAGGKLVSDAGSMLGKVFPKVTGLLGNRAGAAAVGLGESIAGINTMSLPSHALVNMAAGESPTKGLTGAATDATIMALLPGAGGAARGMRRAPVVKAAGQIDSAVKGGTITPEHGEALLTLLAKGELHPKDVPDAIKPAQKETPETLNKEAPKLNEEPGTELADHTGVDNAAADGANEAPEWGNLVEEAKKDQAATDVNPIGRAQENSEAVKTDLAEQSGEARKALLAPRELTGLDRASALNQDAARASERLAELQKPEYGRSFDSERADLRQRISDAEVERDAIASQWPTFLGGKPASFTTEAGVRLDGRYALVDADELVTSHDTNLRQNPDYPQALQPRARDRAASEMQISSIVGKLDPARLGQSADAATGAPIVGADGLVESGNARTIALKRLYEYGSESQKAAEYKAFLEANASEFGLSAEQVRSVPNPVLVRVRQTPVDRAEFARQANASTVAAMSPSEQARADATRLDSLEDLMPDDSGDFSGPASRDFVRRFMARLPATEQAAMVDSTGALSTAGYARVRNAVLAKAYGDSPVLARMTESLDDNVRNLSKALMSAAPEVAKMRAAIDAGERFDVDISGDLVTAVEEMGRLREGGVSVKNALAQADVFGEKYSPEVKSLLQFLSDNARNPRRVAEFIKAVYQALDEAGNPNQGSLLGATEAPTKDALIQTALRKTKGETNDSRRSARSDRPQPAAQGRDGDQGAGRQGARQSEAAPGGEPGAQGDGAKRAGGGKTTQAARADALAKGADQGQPGSQASASAVETGGPEWPKGWRGNFVGASEVARSVGIDPAKYRATIDLVRAIDAARSGQDAAPSTQPKKAKADEGMRVGATPGSAEPVTVKDGVVYVGQYEALNYETGEPVTVPQGSTRADVAKALKDAGALTGNQKVYGLGDAADIRFGSEGGKGQPSPPAGKWVAFPADTGTLGVPRTEMPQIKGGDRSAFLQFLEARGMPYEKGEASADSLKPTQAEFSTEKVEGFVKSGTGMDRSVIVSSDGYVLDGHHQWVAHRVMGDSVPVIRVDAPIRDLLAAANEFPSARRSEGAGNVVDLAARRREAVQDFKDALADLADIATSWQRAAIAPQKNPHLRPTLAKLCDAAVRIVGTDTLKVAKWVQDQLRANPATKKLANKIDAYTLRRAAEQAIKSMEESPAQAGLFGSHEAAAEAVQGDLFGHDSRHGNFKPGPASDFIPADVLRRADNLIAAHGKRAKPVQISPEDRAKAETALRPLMDAAKKDKAAFDQAIVDVAREHGIGQMLAPVKGMGRAAEKVASEYGGDSSRMKDLLRATVVVDGYGKAATVINALSSKFQVVEVNDKTGTELSGLNADVRSTAKIRILNRAEFGGYADVSATIKTPSGTLAEIQINVPAMLAAKEAQGHKLFEVSRVHPKGSDAKRVVDGAMKAIYDTAFDSEAARDFNRAFSRRVSDTQERNPASEQGRSSDTGWPRSGMSSSESSSKRNQRPSGKPTNTSAEEAQKSQPEGNLSGTFISDSNTDIVSGKRRELSPDSAKVKPKEENTTDTGQDGDAGGDIRFARSEGGKNDEPFTRTGIDPKRKVPVTEIAGGAFGNTKANVTGARKRAQVYLKKLRDSGLLMPNDDTGWKIGLSGKSIRELTAFDSEKLNMLLALPRITKNAVLAKSEQPRAVSGNGGERIKAYHTFYAPVRIEGEARIARLVAHEDANGHIAYDLQQSKILDEKQQPQRHRALSHIEGVEAQQQPGSSVMTVADLRTAVNKEGREGWQWPHHAEPGSDEDIRFQRAWHGTPHRGIEEEGFKLNKIGTGEGNQVYGHGIYFAGDREVAESYRTILGAFSKFNELIFDAKGRPLNDDGSPNLAAFVAREKTFGFTDRKIKNELKKEYPTLTNEQLNEAVKYGKEFISESGGQLYSAEIPDAHELLDWDKPLAEQPESVQRALQTERDLYRGSDGMRGAFINDRSTGTQIYREFVRSYGSPEDASQRLNELGIPGLRYLDGNSRGKGKGTHNYVIWDESRLNNDVQTHYMRGPEMPGERPSVDALKVLAEKVSERLPNLPKVNILAAQEEAPPGLREGAAAAGGAKAAVYKGEVYLFADKLGSMAEAEHVLATHEANHVGLAGVLGSGRDAMMQSIARRNPAIEREALAFQKKHRVGLAEAVEEVLADKTPQQMAGLKGWRAVTVATSRWLAPRFPDLARQLRKWLNGKLSDQQRADLAVADLLQAGRDYLSGKGELAQRGALDAQAAFSRAEGGKGLPESAEPVFDYRNDIPIKRHPDYKAAKAGDTEAAARMVRDMVKPESLEASRKLGPDVIYVPVHAEEAGGRNSIPLALAAAHARAAGARVALGIVQTNKAFHTGAGAMERIMNRAEFAGKVEPGQRYVLVDDVSTMGSTLADLAAYIQRNGGKVEGSRLLVNAARGGKITPEPKVIKQLEARHGQAIRETVGISADQLTGPESQYLIGFKSADELRNRSAKAGLERERRLAAKNLSRPSAGVDSAAAPDAQRGNPDDVRFKRGDDDEQSLEAQEKADTKPSSPRAPGESHEAWQRRLALEGRPHMEAALRDEALAQRDIGRGLLREMFAKRDRTQEQAQAAFHDATRYFDKAGEKANLESIDQYETGGATTVKDPVARPYFVAMEKGFQWRVKRIQELAPDAMKNLVEHYFPHIWEDPTKAAQWYQGVMAKRPLQGNRSFLKQRVYGSIKEGMATGLKPVSTNPVDHVMAKIAQMDKFITFLEMRNDLEKRGWIKRVKAGERVPDGYAVVDDPAFKSQHSFIVKGEDGQPDSPATAHWNWAVPEPIAKDINNYLSPSLYRFRGFKLFRTVQNFIMSTRLGLSAFHMGFTTLDNLVTHIDVGARRLLRGDISGLRTLAESPFTVFTSPYEGGKLNQIWMGKAQGDANTTAILNALVKGGARMRMSATEWNSGLLKLRRAYDQGSKIGTAKSIFQAAGEVSGWIIHQKLVPAQKMSARVLLMKYELDRLASQLGHERGDYAGILSDMHPDAIRQIAGKVVNTVDNRLGQMTYDNQFWNKTAREAAQVGIGAVGWQVGTVRTVTGAVGDVARLVDFKRALRHPEELLSPLDKAGKLTGYQLSRTANLSYFATLALTMGSMGAVLQYLLTGSGPSEIKDYFFPKTGRKNADGTDERVSFPSYWMDHYKLATHPIQTASHKLHPVFSTFMETLTNQDYYGNKVRDDDAPWLKQAAQVGEYVAKGFLPYSVKNIKEMNKTGNNAGMMAASFFGVAKAPASVSRDSFQAYVAEHGHKGNALTPDQAEYSQAHRDAIDAMRRGEKPDLSPFAPTQRQKMRTEAQKDPTVVRFNRLGLMDKLRAWDKATDDERQRYKLKALVSKSYANSFVNLAADQKDEVRQRMAAVRAWQPAALMEAQP